MPTRYTKAGEIQQMQYEIANEIRRDAKPIADGVFGNNARHPDMATISNAELDQMYRAAYARNDRTWLMQEAQRDPQQFLDVTDRIGVPDPPQNAQGQPIPSQGQQEAVAQAFQQAAAQNAAASAPTPPLTPSAPAALPPPPTTLPQPPPAIAPQTAPAPGQMPLPG